MIRTSHASPIRAAVRLFSLAIASVSLAAGAWAQGAPKSAPDGKPAIAAGDIVSFEAPKMVVRLRDGSTINLTVPDNAGVTGLKAIPFAELKPGDYIATAAIKQPDGTLRAREVRIFPAEMKGRGEGHNPYPGEGGANSTMTNATVDAVTSTDPAKRSFKVKYKGGEQTVVIPESVPLMRMIPADRSLLKPGAAITVFARETEKGLTAVRFGVGLDGLKPPV